MRLEAQILERKEHARLESLISRIAEGDRHAMESLYQRTARNVYGFALSMLKNAADAEDVLHDCYLQVFQKAPIYRSEGKPMAWILTIVKNLCRDTARRRRRIDLLQSEDWIGNLAEEKHLDHEERLLLEACMNDLAEEERAIVLQHAVMGFKHQEIADDLDMPLSTVLSKYRRALMKLRTAMLKGEPENDR